MRELGSEPGDGLLRSRYHPAMRGAPRLVLCSLLTAAIGLGSPNAVAADDVNSVNDLERRSKLDLGPMWKEYQQSGDKRPFYDYVQARYVHKRDVGRGVLFGGFGVLLAGIIMFSLVAPRTDRTGAKYGSYAVMGGGAVLMIVGGAIWGKNFRRLESLEQGGLEQAGLALGPRGRVRLTSAGPIALRRGGGLGFGLVF
jgi:hypothetical protein